MFGLGDNSTQSTFASQETQLHSPSSSSVCCNKPIIVIDTSHAGLPNNTADPLDPIAERSPVSDAASDRVSATSLRRSHSFRRVLTVKPKAPSLRTPTVEPSTRVSNDGSSTTRETVARIPPDEPKIGRHEDPNSRKRKLEYVRNTTTKIRKLVRNFRARLPFLQKRLSSHPAPSTPVNKNLDIPTPVNAASEAAKVAPETRISPEVSTDLEAVTDQPEARPGGSPEQPENPTVANEVRNNESGNLQSHEHKDKHERISRKRHEKTQKATEKGCRCDRYCHCMRDSSGGNNDPSERSLSLERIPGHHFPSGVEHYDEPLDGNNIPNRANISSAESSTSSLPRSSNRVSFIGIGDRFRGNESRPSSRDTLSFSISSWDGNISPTRSDSEGGPYSSQAPTVVSVGSQVSVFHRYSSGGGISTSRPQTPGILTDGLNAGPESDGDDHTPTQSRSEGRIHEVEDHFTPIRGHFDDRRG
ncbi:MAG: hypothetical protein M1812_002168 [Candelaria pacifica]|nr:MAG: hypothetical protein M1812_002168 [Candelaria pacifica]